MEKIDFKKSFKSLYDAPIGRFVTVDVPQVRYVMVDGEGNPNTVPAYKTAVEWLFSVSYAMKFAAKRELGTDYVVPPLEGLWWADNPQDFLTRRKDRWKWTMMIMVPEFVREEAFDDAVAKTKAKLGDAPSSLRLEQLAEGQSLQVMHVGSYDEEGPILDKLHGEVMPGAGLTFNGKHHEIYIGDPRRTSPERLKTILRQPVRSITDRNAQTL